MKQVKSNNKILLFLLFFLCCLTGCRISHKVETPKLPESVCYLSSKIQLTIPFEDTVFTVNGTMKLISGERIQLSFLMPIIRVGVARMEVTSEEILLAGRMDKRCVRAIREELKDVLPKKADSARLKKILFDASKPGEKRELTGKELGIPSSEKSRVELSGFSYGPFFLTPTELSSKYMEVELSEILEMLMNL